jgi:hypothetical protein
MTTHDLDVPTSDGDVHGAGAVGGSPAPAPTSPEPFTEAEFDSILGTIWNELDGDPHRFDDLLAQALGFIGGIAVRTDHHVAERAAGLLRDMEQRALLGPDHEQEDHR